MKVSKTELIDIIMNYKVITIDILNDNDCEINKKVNKIFVINLLEDKFKRNYIVSLMKKYKINYTLVIVNRISTNLYKLLHQNNPLISSSELGCCLSHLWCLYQVIKHHYRNAIIFEDDIILHKNFIKMFLKIYNPYFDFLLLGCHDFSFSETNYKNVKNNLYRPELNVNSKLYGAHSNYYSLKAAKRMFEIRISEISFFDKEYILMFNYYKDSSYVCYPNLCVSNVTDSHLNHKREILSNLEKHYYFKCFINFNFNNYNFIYINLLSELVQITDNDTYESYIEKCLYHYFYDIESMNIVKKRLTMDFFTINDILNILNLNNTK